MNKTCQFKLLVVICSFVFPLSAHADNLGRIFTSVEERQELEKIRHFKEEAPKKFEAIEVKKIIEPVAVKKEIIIRDPISLKGIVHRSNGKSTAWVNDSNTFSGDYDSQSIQVPDRNIEADQVTIIMPDDSSEVELRVGEVFIPEPIEKDIVEIIDAQDD